MSTNRLPTGPPPGCELKASSGRGRRAKKEIGESKIPGTSQNKNKQAELADLLHRSVLADHSASGGRSRPEEAQGSRFFTGGLTAKK